LNNICDGIYYDFIWNGKTRSDLETAINNNIEFDTVCIVGPGEYIPGQYYQDEEGCNEFINFCKSHNKKVKVILGANVIPIKKDINITWDTYVLNMTIAHSVENNVGPIGHTQLIKPFMSLNGRARQNRLRFLDYMEKYKLIDKGYVSFYNFEKINPYKQNYNFKWWKPKTMQFDKEWFNPVHGYRDFLIPPTEYKNSLWSIASESIISDFFITEKTWMPLYHQRPFITYGCVNFHKILVNKYRFKLYDSIIDYSFDSVKDDELRCDMLMKEVEKICSMDLTKQKEILQPVIDYNFKRVMEIIQSNIVNNEIKYYINKTSSQLELYAKQLNIGSSTKFKDFMIRHRLEAYLK
tara:strand:- start:41338 stop:42393 length:1056 start_codon:yes stop_codon:yes gene_type:complete